MQRAIAGRPMWRARVSQRFRAPSASGSSNGHRREMLSIPASIVISFGVVAQAVAADYPARPIRVIVPYAAGGSTDTVARVIAPRLSQRLGQQVIIDNRTGAGTLVGTEIAAR